MQLLHDGVKLKVRSRKAIFRQSGRHKNEKFPFAANHVAVASSHRMMRDNTRIGKILVGVSEEVMSESMLSV